MSTDSKPWITTIAIDSTIKNANGLSNKISTTKYSVMSWLPKSLLDQFRRIANVYFLVISLLMMIGTYAKTLWDSPLDPFTTLGTLVFVLLVTSIKEGFEDFERAKSDMTENKRKVTLVTFENGVYTETLKETQEIKSGDIIKMTGRTIVPADMLLLLTSNYDDGNQCYIETANIDGETNLKVREAPADIKKIIPKDGKLSSNMCRGSLEFEPPNKNIHNFIGALHLNILGEPMALSAENVLLRSSLFSNTDWGYGLAIYVGQETKVQMNNRLAPSKMSKVESYANLAIVVIFCAQITIVLIAVISIYIMGFDNLDKFPYVYPEGAKSRASVLPLWLEQMFTFFILFNNFIPISLYVTLEMINIGQAAMIAYDKELYEESIDSPCVVRSSNMCQELGLVSNIFSDKTGTLTRNEMKFVQFFVDGRMYDVPYGEGKLAESALMKELSSSGNGHPVFNFLQCLTTCHTVVREKDGTYRAESPDELALVEGVGKFRCSLLERGTTSMRVEMLGTETKIDILAVNAFNADRKRMSILIRTSRDEYYLMCKGADSIMLELCDMDPPLRKSIEKSLLDMAVLGLRTLCVGQKRLSSGEALAWVQTWKDAASSLQDRADKMDRAAAAIEKGMQLLGITAIEDRLQDEVPQVIAELAQAGIVLWMLTGDKEETAINIGRSCNLLKSDTKTFFISRVKDANEYNSTLRKTFEDITQNYVPGVGYRDPSTSRASEIALVMDGPSFKYFEEENKEQRAWLLKIGQCCRSVVACRLTPVQKQMLVGLVKRDTLPKATTLAIGDGANDVSMIREADVGVGIIGKEGRQAANNADFAIGQFKFLRRLCLVHGRWNYVRQSKAFLYSMHKNMVITLTVFWFNYLTALSGQTLYESWVYTSFNFALGLPIVFVGIMDRDISADFALSRPATYSTGRTNCLLTIPVVATWIFNAIIFAILICCFFFYAAAMTFYDFSLYPMGTFVFFALVHSLQLKVALLHHQWNYVNVFMLSISLMGLFFYVLIYSAIPPVTGWPYYWVGNWVMQQGLFWLFAVFSVPVFLFLVDLIEHSIFLFVFPKNEMIFRELDLIKSGYKSSDGKNLLSKYPMRSDGTVRDVVVPAPARGIRRI